MVGVITAQVKCLCCCCYCPGQLAAHKGAYRQAAVQDDTVKAYRQRSWCCKGCGSTGGWTCLWAKGCSGYRQRLQAEELG